MEQLSLQVEQSDSSYMPNLIVISGGSTIGGLKELKETTVPSNCREHVLITGLTEVGVAVGVAVCVTVILCVHSTTL